MFCFKPQKIGGKKIPKTPFQRLKKFKGKKYVSGPGKMVSPERKTLFREKPESKPVLPKMLKKMG